jgi:hypothetical protein
MEGELTSGVRPVMVHRLQTRRAGKPIPPFRGLGLSVPEPIARAVGGRGAYFVPILLPTGDILYRRVQPEGPCPSS